MTPFTYVRACWLFAQEGLIKSPCQCTSSYKEEQQQQQQASKQASQDKATRIFSGESCGAHEQDKTCTRECYTPPRPLLTLSLQSNHASYLSLASYECPIHLDRPD